MERVDALHSDSLVKLVVLDEWPKVRAVAGGCDMQLQISSIV